MYCSRCGAQNPDDSTFCSRCGQSLSNGAPQQGAPHQYGSHPYPPPFGGPAEYIPNYLAQAILVTIFCCLPVGTVSIVFAAQVNGKVARGDIIGARRDSSTAKTWAWVSFGLGLALGAVWFIYLIVFRTLMSWATGF